MTDRAAAFADALNRLETDHDVEGFVDQVFADDVDLSRPEANQEVRGRDEAREFWQQYLDQFAEINSDFSRVVDSGDMGLLEWTSTGRLDAGAPVTYRGVSILDFDADGRVTRFATYYDTAPFSATTMRRSS